MKYQSLFSQKNKKNVSKCCLLKCFIKHTVLALYKSNLLADDCVLTLKMPRKPASENAVCLCCLLNILANFSNLVLHTGKQCGP